MTIPKELQARLRSLSEEEFQALPRDGMKERIREAFRKGTEERRQARLRGYRSSKSPESDMHKLQKDLHALKQRVDALEGLQPPLPTIPIDFEDRILALEYSQILTEAMVYPVGILSVALVVSRLESQGNEAFWVCGGTIEIAEILTEAHMWHPLIRPVRNSERIRAFFRIGTQPSWLVHIPKLDRRVVVCTQDLSHHTEIQVTR